MNKRLIAFLLALVITLASVLVFVPGTTPDGYVHNQSALPRSDEFVYNPSTQQRLDEFVYNPSTQQRLDEFVYNPSTQQRLEIRHFNYDDIMHSEIYQFFSFVRGELIVAAQPHVAYEQIQAFVESLGGQIVGFLELAGFYQLYFPHAHGERELLEVLDRVMASGLAVFAERNLVSVVDNETYRVNEIVDISWPFYFSDWPFPTPTPTPTPTPPPAYPWVMTDIFGCDFFVPYAPLWRGDWTTFVNGVVYGRNWNMEAINAPHAWMHWVEQDAHSGALQINRNKHSIVRVGVIDTFFPEHEDITFARVFGNNIPDNVSVINFNHGIHTAGIIGADFNNNRGTAGVAPNADLYVYGLHSVFYGTNINRLHISLFSIMHSVATLFANDVNIINMSMRSNVVGDRGPHFQALLVDGDRTSLYTFDIYDKLNTALRVERDFLTAFLMRYYDLGQDFLIVQAAGNSSHSVHRGYGRFTVSYFRGRRINTGHSGLFVNITTEEIRNRIIVVGNIDEFFHTHHTSKVGSRVDIFAPGKNIISAHFYAGLVDGVVAHIRHGPISPNWSQHLRLTGTSMAAPHVAGVLAMMWGVNPYLTGTELVNLLLYYTRRYISLDNNNDVLIGARRVATVRVSKNGWEMFDPQPNVVYTVHRPVLDAAAAVNAALAATPDSVMEHRHTMSGMVIIPTRAGGDVVVELSELARVGSRNVRYGRRVNPFPLFLTTARHHRFRVEINRPGLQRPYFAVTTIFANRRNHAFYVIEPVHRALGINVAHPVQPGGGLLRYQVIDGFSSPYTFLFPATRILVESVMTPVTSLFGHGADNDLIFTESHRRTRILTDYNRRVFMWTGYLRVHRPHP